MEYNSVRRHSTIHLLQFIHNYRWINITISCLHLLLCRLSNGPTFNRSGKWNINNMLLFHRHQVTFPIYANCCINILLTKYQCATSINRILLVILCLIIGTVYSHIYDPFTSEPNALNVMHSEIDSVNILISLPYRHTYVQWCCCFFINCGTHDVVTRLSMDGR